MTGRLKMKTHAAPSCAASALPISPRTLRAALLPARELNNPLARIFLRSPPASYTFSAPDFPIYIYTSPDVPAEEVSVRARAVIARHFSPDSLAPAIYI